VNDAYGHLVGDQLLVDIAKILATSTRNTDTVGRWGGEEFLIILPHTQISDAIKIAEKLRTRIDEYDFPVARKMTASFGVTGFTPSDDVVKLINRADVALYVAKDSGRNRVEISV